jgi:uncharacterized MAPEG superfamily protein
VSIELQSLFAVAGILLILVFVQGGLVPATHGLKWGLGPRDEPRDPSVLQGRLGRIVANHLEGMAIFIPLVLIVELAGLSSGLTAAGAVIYAAGRAAFAVIYFLGVPVVRSAAWGVALIGLLMIGFEVAKAAL